jgi:hypothetical protein
MNPIKQITLHARALLREYAAHKLNDTRLSFHREGIKRAEQLLAFAIIIRAFVLLNVLSPIH